MSPTSGRHATCSAGNRSSRWRKASRARSPGSASTRSTRPTSSATGCRRKPTSSLPPTEGRVLAVFGPTASGKTAVAQAVADRLGGEVVSADSMQAYRGLEILTAQPERPTRLVGIWPLEHEGSVAEYAALAHAEIDGLLVGGRVPVVAGGTGLYLRAALVDLGLPPPPPPGLRRHWERLYDRL